MEHQQHDDIQQALEDMRTPASEHTHHTVVEGDTLALAVPPSKYPFGQLLWGMRSGLSKVAMVSKAHPWWAALGLGVAIGCGALTQCIYFGFAVLAGLMVWAIHCHKHQHH